MNRLVVRKTEKFSAPVIAVNSEPIEGQTVHVVSTQAFHVRVGGQASASVAPIALYVPPNTAVLLSVSRSSLISVVGGGDIYVSTVDLA